MDALMPRYLPPGNSPVAISIEGAAAGLGIEATRAVSLLNPLSKSGAITLSKFIKEPKSRPTKPFSPLIPHITNVPPVVSANLMYAVASLSIGSINLREDSVYVVGSRTEIVCDPLPTSLLPDQEDMEPIAPS